jgi:Ca2+-binding EF-hand superfamily protein
MDFFAKKISTLFTRFDMDKNGKIEEDDFDRWSESLISIGHLSASDSDLLRQNMKSIWTTYFLPADFDNDKSVTVEELVVYMRSVWPLKPVPPCRSGNSGNISRHLYRDFLYNLVKLG